MKKYSAPMLNCVELRLEERIASNCTGSCTPDQVQSVEGMANLVALSAS